MEQTVGMKFLEWKPRSERNEKKRFMKDKNWLEKSGKLLVGFYCFAQL